jgi:uncharacterized protein YhaN
VKLLDLTLTRFGHFAGTKLHFGDGAGLFLVYGPNEAGKTTALHAVRALLFGIPVQAARYAERFSQPELRIDADIELQGGLRAELARTKARKETLHGRLLSGGGESVDEGWLNDKLGRPNQDLYNQVFAFSIDVLANGAALLANDAVKGALYGAGFGGSVRPAEIMAALEEQKSALFKEKGRTNEIAKTLSDLDELRTKVKSAVRGSDVYEAIEREWTAARGEAAAKESELAAVQAVKDGLTTTLRALEVFEQRAADVRELGELAVPARFDPAFAAATLRAFDDERRKSAELARASQTLAEQETELAALPSAPELLAAKAVVDRLERSLDRQRAMVTESQALEATERAETERAETELARLRPGWSLADLAGPERPAFAEGKVQRLRELLEKDTSLRDTVRAATAAIEAADEAIAREAARAAALPEAESVDRLEAWVASARAVDDGGAQLDEALRAAATLERRERQVLARVRPLPEAPLETLAPPTTERIEATHAELSAMQTRRATTTERRHEAQAALARAEAALSALDAHDRAPSEAELTTLRRDRDAHWDELVQRINTARDVSTLPSPAELLTQAERVMATDRLADELRWRADAVQKRLRFVEERAQAEAGVSRLDEELARIEAATATTDSAWQLAWRATGITAAAPEAMRAWRSAWEEAMRIAGDRAPAEARVATLRAREASFVGEGLALLGERDSDDRAPTLPTLRAQAEARVQRARERERQREESQRAELDRRREREQAEARRTRALAEQSQWSRGWEEACIALGLASLPPEEARVVLGPLVTLQRSVLTGQAQRSSKRRELHEAAATFAQEVRARIAPLASASLDEAAEPGALFSLVEQVHRDLRVAEKAAARREEIQRLRRANAESRAAGEAELASARAVLDEARAAAGSGDEAVVRRICAHSGDAAKLKASIEGADRELARLRGEREPADFLRDLGATSRAVTEQSIVTADERSAALRTEVGALHQTSGALGEKRKAFDGGSQAADLLGEREAARTKLREFVEAYATAALAHEILQRNIKRFERENKPQLLARAEQLFRIMTDGAFVGVSQDVDRSLLVERPGGKTNRPDELSTGTREQLFLALRLAYIEAYEAPGVEPLPVVLDDVLVNFDDDRALATLRALVTFAERNQVLFFTCHAHLVALSQRANLGLPVLELAPRPLAAAATSVPSASSAPAPLLLESPTEAPARRRKKSG